MKIQRYLYPVSILMLALTLTACSAGGITVNLSDQPSTIAASGTIDADTIRIAPEISGKIKTVAVEKGDTVATGAALFQLDDDLLQAKLDGASAQVKQAEAGLDVARQKLVSAENRYQMALDSSREDSGASEAASWKVTTLDAIDLPAWYFQKSEIISARQAEVDAAQSALDEEQKLLQATLQNTNNNDFVSAEARVNCAQAALEIADRTLTQAQDSVGNDKQALTDATQKIYDQAVTELDAAKKAYNGMLTSTSSTDVKEARARVAAARSRLENAQDALNADLTRDESRQVESAQIEVDSARKAISQAEANLEAAQAAKHEIEVQLEKTSVSAPVAGVILSDPEKAGETVAAGATVYEIGPLDELKLTVYVTENQFGKVKIGDNANVTVDSYANETFQGKVVYISDQAEFTPRNVQTAESRSSTVFAVEIRLSNPDYKLKPGMPADAVIQIAD